MPQRAADGRGRLRVLWNRIRAGLHALEHDASGDLGDFTASWRLIPISLAAIAIGLLSSYGLADLGEQRLAGRDDPTGRDAQPALTRRGRQDTEDRRIGDHRRRAEHIEAGDDDVERLRHRKVLDVHHRVGERLADRAGHVRRVVCGDHRHRVRQRRQLGIDGAVPEALRMNPACAIAHESHPKTNTPRRPVDPPEATAWNSSSR
jgi:hypothetical protein